MGNSNKTRPPEGEISNAITMRSNNRLPHYLNAGNGNNDEYLLIWVDQDSIDNNLDSLRTKMLLREINNNNCLFFSNSDQFLSEIQTITSQNSKVLLILSGSLAKDILPPIRWIIPTIIIFCENSNKYTDLSTHYPNVVSVCTDYDDLKSSIRNEIPSLKFNLFTNQTLKSVISLNESDDLSNYDSFFSYILFIELLKQMRQTKQAKDIMLNKCKDYHRNDKNNLVEIEDFRQNYTSEKAIQWYTKESFIYHLVNRAFRTEDTTLWYLFRYYIIDLCTQLELVHKQQNIQTPFIVYRGQSQMATKELNHLKSNIGSLISTNGFFSSTTNINVAKLFLGGASETENIKVILYEISVSGPSLKNTIFVDIGKYLPGSGEDEILFNIGSIFKIENINYDCDIGAWRIQMKAIDQGIEEIKERIEKIRKKYENGNINLMFGRLLVDMKQYTKAESYFQMMLQLLPKYHQDLSSVYDHLADLNMKISNWNQAFHNFNLALQLKMKRYPLNYPDIAVTLNGIANYYRIIGDHDRALQYYTKSLKHQNNECNIGIILSNIAGISMFNKDYDKALEQSIEARDILHQIDPLPYYEIIYCQGILGDIYLAKQDYAKAEQFYYIAYEMSKSLLFTGDLIKINSIKSLIHLYNKQGFKEKALQFSSDQLSYYEQVFPERHLSHAYLYIEIAQLYEDNDQNKIIYLEKALQILEENIHIQYSITANCYIIVAEYYHKQSLSDKARIYYIKANQIQNKIYPKNHSAIIQTQSIINNLRNQI